MNTLFSRNTSYIKENSPHLAQYLSTHFQQNLVRTSYNQTDIKIKSEKGEKFLFYNSSLPRTAAEEATEEYKRKYSEKIQQAGTGIIFGLGLGYQMKKLIKENTHIKQWYIIEPSPEAFSASLNFIDFQELRETADITFIINPENYKVFFNKDQHLVYRKIMLFVFGRYTKYFPNAFSELNKQLKLSMQNSNILKNTEFLRNKLKTRNLLSNILSPGKTAKLSTLDNYLQNTPIVTVAAGPSLDEELEQLRNNRDKFVIICCDAALQSCIEKNIIPDIVTCIEANPGQWERFFKNSGDKLTGTSLIATLSIDKEVFQNFPGPKFYVDYNIPSQYLFTYLQANSGINNTKPALLPTVNVGLFSLAVANLLGGSPIILLGQDLAYSKNRAYASEVPHKKNTRSRLIAINGQNYWQTTTTDNKTTKVPVYLIENNAGEISALTEQFLYYKNQTEKYIETVKPPVYNCSSRGVKINGTQYITFTNFLAKHRVPDNIQRSIPFQEFKFSTEKIYFILDNLKKSIQNILELCKNDSGDFNKVIGKLSSYKKQINILGEWEPELAEYLKTQTAGNKKDKDYPRIVIALLRRSAESFLKVLESNS